MVKWWLIRINRSNSEKTLLQCHSILKISDMKQPGIGGRAIAQAVSRRLPTAAARVQTRIWSCGILWWTKVALGQVFSENFGLPCHLHSICFSTMIFTVTRGWHNRPGVAAVPIASQTRIKKKKKKPRLNPDFRCEKPSAWPSELGQVSNPTNFTKCHKQNLSKFHSPWLFDTKSVEVFRSAKELRYKNETCFFFELLSFRESF
jgi:hypothetical protein